MNSFVVIEIKGRNQTILIERLKNKGVELLKIRKKDEKTLFLTVKPNDKEKVFAICSDIWYNRQVKRGGAYKLKALFTKALGAIIGALLFVACCFYANGFLLDVSVIGANGAELDSIYTVLENNGVKKFASFSKLDLKKIENEVFSNVLSVDFVTAKKSGNRLIIELIPSEASPNAVEKFTDISAKRSGKIIMLSVFHGRAAKKIGDVVKAGEIVIEGVTETIEGSNQSYALGEFLLECEYSYEYFSPLFIDKTAEAYAYAVFMLSEAESEATITASNIEAFTNDYGVYYRVTLKYTYFQKGA